MKKRKVLGLTALGILLAYIFCVGIIFFVTDKEVQEGNNANFSQDIYDMSLMANPVKDNENTNSLYDLERQDKRAFLNWLLSGSFTKVYTAGLFDKDGNLKAQNTSSIILILSDSDFDSSISYYCNLDKYLTQEMKDILVKRKNRYNYFTLNYLEYNLDENDEIVPVKMKFKSVSDDEPEIEFVFSKDLPSYSYNVNDEYTSSFLNFDTVAVRKSEEKRLEELNEMLISDETKELVLSVFDTNSQDPDITQNDNRWTGTFLITQGKEPYAFVAIYERSMLTTLFNHDFIFLFELTTVICSCILIVVLIITNIIYNKNKRIDSSKKAFINAAAHELKTPLAVISNNCECAIENISPEKNQGYLESSYEETQRMSKLVESLLSYNRMMSSDKIVKKDVDLAVLAKRECNKYKTLFESKNISLEENLESSIVNCSEELITLAIDNFLSNAYKYSSEGAKVTVSVKKIKKSTVFSVFNTCAGIKKEDLPHIWEELYTADKSRNSNKKSSGMGLAINKKIFDLHKFKYSCKNVQGGIEFSFTAK